MLFLELCIFDVDADAGVDAGVDADALYYTKKEKTLFIYIICRKNFFMFFQKVFKKYLTLYNGGDIIIV